MLPADLPVRDRSHDDDFCRLLVESYRRLTGQEIGIAPADLHDAPFALLAHDNAADPRLVYANRAALACFGYEASELIGLPSRLTAETPERAAREHLLAAVTRNGFVSGYTGVRIAKSGRRFRIEDTTIWNLVGPDGAFHGQAALIRGWKNVG